MDVQAASATVTTGGTSPAAEVETPTASSGAAAAPTVSASTKPTSESNEAPHGTQPTTLAPAIAKLFGSSSNPEPIPLNVSYRILKGNLGEIVTVFTDPKSGKEVAQFPPEILIGLATFFDQESGVTLDTNA